MRVLVCPDKFAGTLTATAAAQAICDGWGEGAPADEVRAMPLSDGGPGFLAGLRGSVEGATLLDVPTVDPLGRPVPGSVLLLPLGIREREERACEPRSRERKADIAYIESAMACGLHLLAPAERDPRFTTSYGLGVLVAAAVEAGAREVVVGLGGSGTNDAGAGMLAALGAAPLDAAGYALPYGGAALLQCASLGGVPRLRGVALVAATDVDSPLCGPAGASAVYGPQKGASTAEVALLDAALARFAAVLSTMETCPSDVALRPGAGAAGGLGAALLACGGRRESGFGVVGRAVGLEAALAECELVVTGEGSFDDQSLHGKVVAGVAALARQRGIPCVVLAGRVSAPAEAAAAAGVTSAFSLAEHLGSVEQAMAEPAEGLRSLAAHLSRGSLHRVTT